MMKVKFSMLVLIVVLAQVLVSFKDPIQKKKITDINFRYEFYTTQKKISPKQHIIYYWFKAGVIHNSENGTSGELLHEGFEKFYLDNQLAEKGTYTYGQKEGSWKTWHKNGMLDTKQYWQDGRKHGKFYSYDTNGVLVEKGYFKKGLKNGKWINFIKKDTVLFKSGTVFIKKIKLTKEEKKILKEDKQKLKLQKKLDLQNKKEAAKKERLLKKKNKEAKKVTKEAKKNVDSEKQGFFKRLFAKKEKKPDA